MTKICETMLFRAKQTGCISTEDIITGAKLLDNVGYRAIEIMAPPSTEDKWKKTKQIKQALKVTPVLVSLDTGFIKDNALEHFIELGLRGGVDIFRIHTTTNDITDMQRAIGGVIKAGKQAEGTIVYTERLSADFFTDLGKSFKDHGCQSLCLSDPNGILGPQRATELLDKLKKTVGLPMAFYFSSPYGLAETTYYAAASFGVDSLYCMLCPIAGTDRLPRTKTIVTALAGTNWSTNLKTEALDEAARHFEPGSARGPRAYDVVVSGSKYHVTVRPSGMGADNIPAAQAQVRTSLTVAKPAPKKASGSAPIRRIKTRAVAPRPAEKQATGGTKNVRSTMEGTILDILIKEGDAVERGTRLLILEAMKMQNQVLSPVSGTVAKIMVKVGETVKDGQNLIIITV